MSELNVAMSESFVALVSDLLDCPEHRDLYNAFDAAVARSRMTTLQLAARPETRMHLSGAQLTKLASLTESDEIATVIASPEGLDSVAFKIGPIEAALSPMGKIHQPLQAEVHQLREAREDLHA